MSEPLHVTCPECRTGGQVRPEDAGHMVSCPGCKNTFLIPAPPARRTVDARIIHRSGSRWGFRIDPELKSQLAGLTGLLIIVAVFGRDWLRPQTSEGNQAGSTQRGSATASVLPSTEGPSRTATKTKSAGEKLPLGNESDERDSAPVLTLDDRLPPVQPLVRRRAMPLDSAQAMGVRGASFLPDNVHAMTIHATDRGNLLRKWVIDSGAPVGQPVLLPNGRDFHLRFSPNGSRLAVSVSQNNQGLMLLNAKTGVTMRTKQTKMAPPLSCPVWKDDGTLFYGSSLGTVESWDILTEENGLSLSQGQAVTAVGVSDAGYLLSGDTTGELRLWALKENARYAASYRKLKAPIRLIETRRAGQDVLVLAAAGEPGKSWDCHIFDLATQETVHTVSLPGEVTALAVSSDWRRIVTGHHQGQVVVIDTLTGDELESSSVHFGEVNTVAIANDNSCMMTGCYQTRNDVTVRLRPMPPVLVRMQKDRNTDTQVQAQEEEDAWSTTEDIP